MKRSEAEKLQPGDRVQIIECTGPFSGPRLQRATVHSVAGYGAEYGVRVWREGAREGGTPHLVAFRRVST